jgi:hypothetical protein
MILATGESGRAGDNKFPARWRGCVMLNVLPKSFIPFWMKHFFKNDGAAASSPLPFSSYKLPCFFAGFSERQRGNYSIQRHAAPQQDGA